MNELMAQRYVAAVRGASRVLRKVSSKARRVGERSWLLKFQTPFSLIELNAY
jgi:hypothetical protein